MAKVVAQTAGLTMFFGTDGGGTAYICAREGQAPKIADQHAMVDQILAKLREISPEAVELAKAFAEASKWRPAGHEDYRKKVAAGTADLQPIDE